MRPLTSRLPARFLLLAIQALMPVLFPLTEILFRLPRLGRGFQFLIPVANYVGMRELGWRARYRLAVLDTLDMLAPRYDSPFTEAELRVSFRRGGITAARRLPGPGLTLAGEKPAAQTAEA